MIGKAKCACHVWIVFTLERLGRCGRCGEVPVMIGPAEDDDATECLHEDECKP